MNISHLDHLVLTVADIEKTVDFYTRVLGMQAVTFGEGRKALTFGNQQRPLFVGRVGTGQRRVMLDQQRAQRPQPPAQRAPKQTKAW